MSKVTACICVMVVLLVIQVATAQGFSRDGPAKFMRWGKRGGKVFFFSFYIVFDILVFETTKSSQFVKEIALGNKSILCTQQSGP